MLTAEQIIERGTGIGGSDAAGVAGLSEWSFLTPLTVYLKKIGEHPPEDESAKPWLEWGNLLEPIIAEKFAQVTGKRVIRRNQMFRHKVHTHMIGNLDRWVTGERAVLEVKTANQFTANKWGEDGSDEVPVQYLLQCMHYMIVTGAVRAYLAVLIGNSDFRIFHIPYRQSVADQLIQIEHDFWHNHVLAQVPPEPINLDDAKLRWRKDDGSEIEATPAVLAALEQLQSFKQDRKTLEQEIDALQLTVQNHMRHATTLTFAGERVATWKHQTTNRIDTTRLRAERPEIAAAYTKTTESRVFRA